MTANNACVMGSAWYSSKSQAPTVMLHLHRLHRSSRSMATARQDCAVCSPGYATTLPYHCNKCLEKTS
ncbi:unnamed protein product, partial [Ascophyllum nodosum]